MPSCGYQREALGRDRENLTEHRPGLVQAIRRVVDSIVR